MDNCSRVTKKQTIDNIIAQLKCYPKTETNKIISARLSNLQCENDDFFKEHKMYYQMCIRDRVYVVRNGMLE